MFGNHQAAGIYSIRYMGYRLRSIVLKAFRWGMWRASWRAILRTWYWLATV